MQKPQMIHKCDNLNHQDYINNHLKKQIPTIISNALEWDAIGKWTPSYLKEKYPNKDLALTVFDPTINMPGTELPLKLSEAIDLICNNQDKHKKHYLMQRSVEKDFPELLPDFDLPKYADKNKKHVINFWFGESATNTKPHYDYSNNFLTQICGRKRVRLYAPSSTVNMYPYSIKDTVTMGGVKHPVVQGSQIADTDFINETEFPNFRLVEVFEGILYPGDLLFIPAGWWHEVKSLDVSMSINFWWMTTIETFPRKQLTDVLCSYFHWYGDSFHENVRLAFDLTQFSDDLQVAEFALTHDLRCVSALFILTYLCLAKTIDADGKIAEWKHYLITAEMGDDALLERDKLHTMIHTLKTFDVNKRVFSERA